MKVVEEYQKRIRPAATLDEKKALAAELHRLSDTFNESQREEYQSAMAAIRDDIADKLEALTPHVQRAEALLARIKSGVSQS